MREIAIRAGRGKISSSTVHNIFRRSRVPRWAFLEQVVNALGGARRARTFLALWEAAWRAENDVAAPQREPQPTRSTRPLAGDQLPTGCRGQRPRCRAWPRASPRPRPGQSQRIWSNEIPPRNANFTGSERPNWS